MLRPLPGKSTQHEKNSEDLALFAKIRLGDRNAFAALYSLYQPRLYGFIARLIDNTALVEEVLDDVMLVAWEDCRKFRGESRLSTWIFGIAYRKSMKAMRREMRQVSRIDRSTDPDDIGQCSPSDDDAVEVAIRNLSPEHRQVVVLTYYGGFAYKEIAKIAGCPVATVKTRMFYARRAMKAFLGAKRQAGERHD